MTLFIDLFCALLIWVAIVIQGRKPAEGIDNLASLKWFIQGLLVGTVIIIQKYVGWGDYAQAFN